jgi:hypothetical protein
MRTIPVIYLAYVLALAACVASSVGLLVGVGAAPLASLAQHGASSRHPTLMERRRMAAVGYGEPQADARPKPVRALVAPDLAAGVLAANLDAAESAEAPRPRERLWRAEARRGHSPCLRHCRAALERRLEALE